MAQIFGSGLTGWYKHKISSELLSEVRRMFFQVCSGLQAGGLSSWLALGRGLQFLTIWTSLQNNCSQEHGS